MGLFQAATIAELANAGSVCRVRAMITFAGWTHARMHARIVTLTSP